jgi:hypothetical protein
MAPQTTTTMRDANALDAEVAQLRTQAQALHAARADATKASDTKWGGLRDDAARDADAARHASTRANEQAIQQQESAKDFLGNARALETTASEAAAAGDHARAAELREDAQQQRSLAVAADERAARAHKAAADQATRVDKLEQEVRDYDKRITGEGDETTPAIERLADQLDEKASLLAQAADAQRSATRFHAEGNTEAATRATQSAVDALGKADAIQPSFSSVDAAVLSGAGITPVADRSANESPEPGSETIGPDASEPDRGDDSEPDTIDPSETLNPFEDSDVTGTSSTEDVSADPIADGSDTEGVERNDGAFASTSGFDDVSTSAFDEPVTFDNGFQDFTAPDDPIDAAPADGMSFELES